MRQSAEVTEVFPNGTVKVRTERRSACAGCTRSNGCSGSCAVGDLAAGDRSASALAINEVHAELGDTVEIEARDTHILALSLLVFIAPLVMAAVGYAVGMLIFSKEQLQILTAAVFFVFSFALIGVFERIYRKRRPDITVVAVTHVNKNGWKHV